MNDLIGQIKDKLGNRLLKIEEKQTRRLYLDLKPEDIPDAVRFIFRDMGCRFVIATGIDTPVGIEILYHLSFDPKGIVISLRTLIKDKKHPEIASIASIIKGAEWIEREMWELLGIDFTGHPNLKHLLLVDDWPEGKYPLRKSR